MDAERMTIDILCKVVDNYGDIGVVYRLAKALGDADPGLRLRLVVDDLAAFRCLAPSVDPGLPVQELNGWTVVQWNHPWEGFRAEPPRTVLECFACGRPDFFEECLFDPGLPFTARIVNVEHLTAEAWADDLHRMPSLTRSSRVKKHIFMPGFTAATGGLIMDRTFAAARERWNEARAAGETASGRTGLAAARMDLAARAGIALEPGAGDGFWVTAFSYERDYGRAVADLAAFHREELAAGRGPVVALAAAGKSQPCFMAAWESAGKPFPALALPFLPQETWDEFLLAADFSIVRGEETLARASLAGRPFLWQAYLQADELHLVKLRAFLDRVEPHLDPDGFAALGAASLAFNRRDRDHAGWTGDESILPLLGRTRSLEGGFGAFSAALAANGDMAGHLLTFLRDLV